MALYARWHARGFRVLHRESGDPGPARRVVQIAMATGSLISVREYLSTSYRPDCDYVDGVVVERNLGEYDHGRLQAAIIIYFSRHEEWGVEVVPEQRVQVSPTRFRVPDLCVVVGKPSEPILHTPPLICFEILSRDDRLPAMR